MGRSIKRFIIFIIFLTGIVAIGLAFYFMFKQDPTCFDGVRNQNEEGVDCGGPCKPCSHKVELEELEIGKIEWVEQRRGFFSVAIEVRNPNEYYGAEKFKFRGFDEYLGEEKFGWQEGFILPGETKHLTVHNIALGGRENPNFKIEFDKKSFNWERFTDFATPNLEVYNSGYELLGQGSPFYSRAKGAIFNDSDVDFEFVTVKVFLRDASKNLIGIGQQSMNTLPANDRREFYMNFKNINGEVVWVDQEVETNVFDSENYIRVHGKPEVWDYRE